MEAHEEKVDFFKFQRKVNTLLGMPLYVYSMNRLGRRFGAALTTFHQSFTEIIVIIVTIGQLWAIPHIYENMNVLCGCLSSCTHSIQMFSKTILLKKSKTQYLTHIKQIHSLQKDIDEFERNFLQRNSHFETYNRKQTQYVNVIVLLQLLVNFVSTSAYFLPFVYDSIVNRAEVKNQLTPIVVYLPTDFNFTPAFQVVILTLTVGFYVINLKTVVLDNFILSLIVFHMSQLTYHNELLKEVIKSQITSGRMQQDVVRAWIRKHQALSRVCSNFKKLISPYLFIEFSYILIHTCLPAFVITSTFSWTLPQKVAVFCMVGGGLIELFLMSSAGGAYSNTWTSIKTDLFQSEFIENSKWMKHAIIIIQRKIQKSFYLSALDIVPLNRGTFASILRLIFSYYMTLNQIQKIKRID